MISQPVWRKQLDEKFSLLEYPEESNSPNCVIQYEDEERDFWFAFGFRSWGMERDEITVEDCLLCCQAMLEYNASSFASNLKYARNELDEAEDEDEDDSG